MQIRDYMTKLFDAIGDTKEVTREMLLDQAELIHTISDKCQSTGLFLDSQAHFNQFIQEIEADDKVEDRLLHAWCWLLDRIVKAPTSFHMDGAVILTMPLVARYLPPVEREPETIVVNLDEDYKAPVDEKPLRELVMERRHWPLGATCATQEADGEIIYWDAPVDEVEKSRKVVGKHGIMAEVGLKHQVDAWYADMDDTQFATDWNTAVITPHCLLLSYLDVLQKDKVPFDKGVQLAAEWVKQLGGESREDTQKALETGATVLSLGRATAHCFKPYPDTENFYYEA
ncbi:hypothetical protein Xets_04104 [Xenorhabdus sp. TS4]|nr:hypothetical protein [Xenorhabdus sp. TS4]MBC8951297.1 hypothetical protein [Xenorhabdus sp. TS4]